MAATNVKAFGFEIALSNNIEFDEFYHEIVRKEDQELKFREHTNLIYTDIRDNYIIGAIITLRDDKRSISSFRDDEGNLIKRLWSSWDSNQNAWSSRSIRTYIYEEASVVEDDEAYSLASIDLYPLPARNHVRIDINLGKPTPLTVDVYDLLGRQVVRLREDLLAAGSLQIDWLPGDLVSGLYLVRIQTGQRVETKKLVLVK